MLALAGGGFYLLKSRFLGGGDFPEPELAVSLTGETAGEEISQNKCDGSAGFVWCDSAQKCYKQGEEFCEDKSLTSGWPIFQNQKYGYVFKHPADCFLGPRPDYCLQKPPEERLLDCLCFLNNQDPNRIFLQTLTGPKNNLTNANFSIIHLDIKEYNPPAGTELAVWLKKNLPQLENIPDQPNLMVAGLPAVRVYTPAAGTALSQEDIFLIKGDKLFQFYLLNVDAIQNKELYYQLLATFKFSS